MIFDLATKDRIRQALQQAIPRELQKLGLVSNGPIGVEAVIGISSGDQDMFFSLKQSIILTAAPTSMYNTKPLGAKRRRTDTWESTPECGQGELQQYYH